MTDLGDISEILKEGSGSGEEKDLGWLEVDEKDYRKDDVLPKQNLDILPDLESSWSHEDKDPVAYFVPNQDRAGLPVDPRLDEAPNTMGDMSQLHGPQRDTPESLIRTARMSLMESPDIRRVMGHLMTKFPKDFLRENKASIQQAMSERGLLGRLYIAADDFPDCTTSNSAVNFVNKNAKEAQFVVQGSRCADCSHRISAGSQTHCGMFHKQLVVEVPYSDELAEAVERSQKARGKAVQASTGNAKERIRSAFLSSKTAKPEFSGQDNKGAVIPAERLLRKVEDPREVQASLEMKKAEPIVATLRRELLKGRRADEIVKGLKLSFDVRDLAATRKFWEPLFREAGLYGSVYSTQDSFQDCREGANFLSKHASKVRAIVAGEKCSSCIYSQAGMCMMYGRKLVARSEDIINEDTVRAVLDEHQATGKISSTLARQSWGKDPREALKNIHNTSGRLPVPGDSRTVIERHLQSSRTEHTTGSHTRREILKVASRFMNEGLYGVQLRESLKSRFDPRDLQATADDLRKLFAEEGLQGIYYVDPSVYEDYGHGCKEAQRLHRSRASVRYAKIGGKCVSCVHHSSLGQCSVMKKDLVLEPPYMDKTAQQQAILESVKSTDIDYNDIVNNGLTMMAEYELQNQAEMSVEASVEEAPDYAVEFGSNEVDIKKL